MKKLFDWGLVPIGIIVCLVSVIAFLIRPAFLDDPRQKMQEDLAKRLGVKIEDYPYVTSFPAGYFYTILQPGMTISEVHSIVQGYEKVLHCGSKSEIYYYFSTELEDAKRFEIRYDDQGKFSDFLGEEDDSRTLQTNGCEPGRITR